MGVNFKKVDKLVEEAMRKGLTALGDDVKKRAIVLAPVDSGQLRRSSKVEVNSDSVEVSFNTAYARRRHYENDLHPATRLYLTQALKSITNVKRYFKETF